MKLESIHVVMEEDECPDLSYLDTEYDLITERIYMVDQNGEEQYAEEKVTGINIISSCRYNQADVETHGWREVKRWIDEDAETRNSHGDSWISVGIFATASITDGRNQVKVSTPGVWGIEYRFRRDDQIESVAGEEVASLAETLRKIGIPDVEIEGTGWSWDYA
jgi:hypothetical protein